MPIYIINGDITTIKADAIVNAANNSLLGGGGVDGAIHRAAGWGLFEECKTLGGCATGDAKITNGYNLPAKHVIHTVGPIWRGGENGEEALLESCYKRSLELAREAKCQSIAFPLISAGVYGYPKAAAFKVAYDTVKENLDDDIVAYIVMFEKFNPLSDGDYGRLRDYVGSEYENAVRERESTYDKMACLRKMYRPSSQMYAHRCDIPRDLEERIVTDESFAQMLLRKIDEKGMTDAQCYKRANVDRKHFSKIRSDAEYHPSKATAIAFAIALELDLKETNELLKKAGYALSRSYKFDLIIEYYMSKGNYDIFEINKALYAFDQKLLGC